MDFLHAGIHHARLDELRTGVASPFEFARAVVFVACPVCGDSYFADLSPDDEPALLDADEWAAQVKLVDECPDHAHRFSVGWP